MPGTPPDIPAAVVRELAERVVRLYHAPHPHLARRAAAGPVKAADQLPAGGPLARFNSRLGVLVTRAVGTMWCAYGFAGLALTSLPEAIRGGTATAVSWTAQTLLQLVLLSVIMVGQRVQTAAGDARAKAAYDDGEAVLHYVDLITRRLGEIDAKLEQRTTAPPPAPAPGPGPSGATAPATDGPAGS